MEGQELAGQASAERALDGLVAERAGSVARDASMAAHREP
ncbi:MAG: HAD-IB family hydrolase, partial [Mycobacteriaceae bacterium]|nr:HAD-IB family hydrolase [Mycobacteriaceae bacterium]